MLDDQKFVDIICWGCLLQVFKGIDVVQCVGICVKINIVVLKGFNEDELFMFQEWCVDCDMDLIFIEVMLMGDIGNEDCFGQYWVFSDLCKLLGEVFILIDLVEWIGGLVCYVCIEEIG